MHENNPHLNGYNFNKLVACNPALKTFVITTKAGSKSIDFSKASAVFELNKALLIHHYGLISYNLPGNYLIPPVPGRADYLWYLKDILNKLNIIQDSTIVRGLDIGTGANGIYPILGSCAFNWQMVGADIDANAIEVANKNVEFNSLENSIELRYQSNPSYLFKNIIKAGEYFHFTMCNPPFHGSAKGAEKEALRKTNNLKLSHKNEDNKSMLNFNGQANELWCNGGEALFIKRLIKESVAFSQQVGVFTCLVAKEFHLPKIYRQLDKLKAQYTTVAMQQGNKKSRFIAWWFKKI